MILTGLIIFISTILLVHSLFTLLTMAFSWNDPHTLHLRKSPKQFLQPFFSFTLLVPVRNEASVIADTLKAMTMIRYPKELCEVFLLCRQDDEETLQAIQHASTSMNIENVKLVIVGEDIDNKPKALNIGLSYAKNQVVAVFDAEDEPHPEILNVVNTMLQQTKSDVVQSGVQLMNYTSRWFSALNVLEYYFWFKSALHFFTVVGVVPLGGNTVFIKRGMLEKVGGWDENMLTEDADLGIRLSLEGAKVSVVYDEQHVTREEAPSTIAQFIKQRTRWNQGFLQIFFQFNWLRLPGFQRKALTAYLLFMPVIQGLWVIYLPLTLLANFSLALPVGWAIFSLLPGYVLMTQFVLYNYGLYEFTRDYKYKYSILLIPLLFFSFFPYQVLLSIAAIRAACRLITGEGAWEKTAHLNIHRSLARAS